MKKLYAGFDLHGNNNYLGIIDGDGRRVFKKKLSNDLEWIREVLLMGDHRTFLLSNSVFTKYSSSF